MPLWRKPLRGSVLDPYRDHLAEGCRNAARLGRELTGMGVSGPLHSRARPGGGTAQDRW